MNFFKKISLASVLFFFIGISVLPSHALAFGFNGGTYTAKDGSVRIDLSLINIDPSNVPVSVSVVYTITDSTSGTSTKTIVKDQKKAASIAKVSGSYHLYLDLLTPSPTYLYTHEYNLSVALASDSAVKQDMTFTTAKQDLTKVTGTGDWFYSDTFDITNYPTYDPSLNNTPSLQNPSGYFEFTTEALCNTARQSHTATEDDNGKTIEFSNCFKSTTHPPAKSEFTFHKVTENDLPDGYWYEAQYDGSVATNTIYGRYNTLDACKKSVSDLTSNSKYTIIRDCFAAKKQPTANNTDTEYKKDSYTLLAPIPGLDKVDENTTFSDYLNIILKLAIAIASLLAVIMIVVGGIQYMSTDAFSEKAAGKARIMNAIIGLLLALGAYAILNTLNPALVNTTVTLQTATVQIPEKDYVSALSAADYEKLTGLKVLTKTDYDAMAKTIAGNDKSQYCALKVILYRESGADPGSIGQDENVPRADVGSRRDFINSGVKYSGTKFDPKSVSITDASFKNDTLKNGDSSRADLGLDWRFTNGIGLGQITLTGGLNWKKGDAAPTYKAVDGTTYTVKDLLKAETSLKIALSLYNQGYKTCNGEKGAWIVYAYGSCLSNISSGYQQEVDLRDAAYQDCMKNSK